MWRVENTVSRVSVTFDEHMRRLFEHNHLAYIPFPLMMPLVRAAMSVDPSTSSSTAAVAAGTSEKLLLSLSPSVSVTDNVPLVTKSISVCYQETHWSVTK
ncbi:hypothetical protein M9H77_06774 [Catharanthus roseus]|uniref:Uncharacterized protein n=1 Tax=Catharanthus roseus TaxID=4058 RepID=A0ACC0BT99_CATRO|nr:hypothetical protein M9H77_06774 [Catharanthus roseus]